MKKIALTESQLNRLVEATTVFKDEEKLKGEVESHLSEEKELCGCGCDPEKCECGPDCKKCDCGKKKEAKEDWDPTGSVGVSGVGDDAARRGTNTLWENKEIILKDFKRFL